MSNTAKATLWCIIIAFIFLCVAFTLLPAGRSAWNSWFFDVQKADDATRYTTRKTVEDTCRAMIASYTSDMMTWDLYKNSEIAEKQSWAEQARMRANKTAASYNEYVLKNGFVWEGNIPLDIDTELAYLN